MRVGILTFHRANNYGAVLQCYALQESLRGLGYDAFVIDYRQQFVEMVYKKFSWRYLFTLLRTRPLAIPIYLMNCDERGVMRPLFTEFRNKHLRLTAECHKNIPQNVDTYIIGSDQLWGNNCTGGIDPIYYGEFARTMQHKIYSYAISSYADSINKLSRSQIRNFARNFAALSFRESKIAQMVATRSKQPTRVDIDPTLLLDAEQWSGITSTRWHERRYVLLYQLRTKKGRGAKLKRKAQELATNMECELIDICAGRYSVEDFVSLFKYAQYVVTSSFHGTAFSVIFNRPLYSVTLDDGHDERCRNLLTSIGAEGMLTPLDSFDPTPQSVDYTTINQKVAELRNESVEYLKGI